MNYKLNKKFSLYIGVFTIGFVNQSKLILIEDIVKRNEMT